jgi:3',5'-cyclic-nucleotide phosphodiesterase
MDYAACNVVYVDRTAQEDRLVRREDATPTAGSDANNSSRKESANAVGDIQRRYLQFLLIRGYY